MYFISHFNKEMVKRPFSFSYLYFFLHIQNTASSAKPCSFKGDLLEKKLIQTMYLIKQPHFNVC